MNKFIRDKDNLLHITNDDWKTFQSIKRKSIDGVEETDRDVISAVKLRYELGDVLAKIILDQFDVIRSQFDLQCGDGYGHAFEIFAIAVLYNIDYNIVFNNYIVTGADDGKIDAIYWKGDINKIYQIKMDYLDYSEIGTIDKNYYEFISTGNISNSNTKDLLSFCNKHKVNINREKAYEIVTISNNGKSSNDKNRLHISSKDIYLKYFENYLLNKTNDLSISLSISRENGIAKTVGDNTIYAYFADAKVFIEDLLKCDNIGGNINNLYKLFYDNVRGNLGINKAMEETINKDPYNFVKYNNGVTITGLVKYTNAPCLIVEEPIINNGQQTIWNLINKYPNIEGISLLVIVKNESNYKIKGKISKYTNTQKNIKPIDLLSLDTNIRKLQSQLFRLTIKNNPIFLEINTSGERHYNKLLKVIYKKENIIHLVDFCKLYFAVESNKLGDWKSNVSKQLADLLEKDITYDVEKSLMVCNSIINYKNYLQSIDDKNIKNILRTADLAFMYIQYKYGFDDKKTHAVIDKINKKFFYDIADDKRKSKIIDLYKSNDIVNMIESVIEKNDTCKISPCKDVEFSDTIKNGNL